MKLIFFLLLCAVIIMLWQRSIRQEQEIRILTDIVVLQNEINKNNITIKENLIKMSDKTTKRKGVKYYDLERTNRGQ